MTRARCYGEALYSLAREEGLEKDMLSQLTVLQGCFQENPDFLRLLSLPDVPHSERCQIIDTCFGGKVQPYLINFLKLLSQKGLVRSFGACCEAFEELYNRDYGILPVKAYTAVPLNREQLQRLTQKLADITGKTPKVENRVDPDCLGGVRLDYDGKEIDGSLEGRLQSIRKMLDNTVL